MKTNHHKTEHSTKGDVIRARCDADLKLLVEKAAKRLHLDAADIIRMGVQDFAARVVYQPFDLTKMAA